MTEITTQQQLEQARTQIARLTAELEATTLERDQARDEIARRDAQDVKDRDAQRRLNADLGAKILGR
jgi:septal ring factor EnvC (AmiA/AmiB activator)